MQVDATGFERICPSLRVARAALMLIGLLALSACRARNFASVTADDLVHKYLVLVVELGERDPDSLDFYVGNDPSVDKFKSQPEKLEGLHHSALALSEQVQNLPDSSGFSAERRASLLAQIGAIILRTEELQGTNSSFDQESQTLFGVVAPPDRDQQTRTSVRAEIARLLGNDRDTAAAYSRFEAKFVVRPERIPAVMDAALRQCRALTLQHMTLPGGEHVDVEYVFHKPWSGFSHYLGNSHSVIQVNMDYPMTVDRILNLACHEGYPGHHVFNSLRDQALVHGLHRDEFLAQPTFSPQSFVSEAAASYAPTLLLPDAERLRVERDLLFPLAGLKGVDPQRYLAVEKLIAKLHTAEPSIARDYLDGRLEFVRAADALERETLMEHGETTLLYLNEYRTYMLSYTVGSDAVQAYVEDGDPSEAVRWQRYLELMKNPVVSLRFPAR
jgi:hypothetical protein